MSIHKFGYSAESLQKDKIENLEKEFESQTKLFNIKLIIISDKLENFENLQSVQEINFDDGETKVVVNAKLFLDINKDTAKLATQIEDLKINLKYLEQDVKNKFLEKKKEKILDAAKLVEEQQTILCNHFERNLISELEKCKNQTVKDTIQLLYNKGLFDSFENKDQIFNEYLYFSDEYLLEKYGKEIKTSDGVYYLSDLDYSTREDIVKCLKKDEYKDIVDLKYRMKLTDTEINFILFEN